MPVTYNYLTPEQQRTTAESQAFAAEHGHLIASIDLAADPSNPEKQARVALLEATIEAAKAVVSQKGGTVPVVDAGEAIPG